MAHAEVGQCLGHRALCVVLGARLLGCYEFGRVSLVKPIDTTVGRHFANDLVGIISSLEMTDGIRPIPFGLAGFLAIAQRFAASGGECLRLPSLSGNVEIEIGGLIDPA